MQRVLITGARGFIGGHLTHRLVNAGYAVRALTRSRANLPTWPNRVDTVIGDLDDDDALTSAVASCDTVFHLAAHVHAFADGPDDDARHQRVNFEGTRNLVTACVASGVKRFVFFSTVKTMGERTVDTDDETAPPRPQTAYGRSKLLAEDHLIATAKKVGFAATCLRLPLVYGVGNQGNLSRMIAAIDRGRFPPLPEVHNRRSMVHVHNVIDAAVLAATTDAVRGRRYIVTDARPYSTRELYTSVCRALARPIPRWTVPYRALKIAAAVGDGVRLVTRRRCPIDSDSLEKLMGTASYSCALIARELGYQPQIDFDQALPELVRWHREASL